MWGLENFEFELWRLITYELHVILSVAECNQMLAVLYPTLDISLTFDFTPEVLRSHNGNSNTIG